ncbi:MAG: response regulator transcription factor [Clostridiales bacterium]|nr:response regulator transcription factor [Clostridiales bacterium]
MYKALIVDDHESMRDALAYALEATGEFSIAGSLPAAAHAEAFCERQRPDLVLMDVCAGGGASGLDAAKAIRGRFPEVKVIVMTGFPEITFAMRAKNAGAHAFVHKNKSLAHFIEVARKVMTGEICYPESKAFPPPMGETPLTEREMEVLRLICKHMTGEEIAEELSISASTVKFHRSNLLAKTGFARTADLAFYMITNGWINPLY